MGQRGRNNENLKMDCYKSEKINSGKEKELLLDSDVQKHPFLKRNKKEYFKFGNYKNYYEYRIGEDLDEDPRMSMMKREWFEGKDCLDIGCNCGLITISVAIKFGCKSILGVDIDRARIREAFGILMDVMEGRASRSNSKRLAELVNSLANHAAAKPLPDGTQQNCGKSLLDAKGLDKIISFEAGDFVQNWRAPVNKTFHAILCLSVTKWVHLNWGDDGLVTLFWKVWTLLEPGGVFILEPQTWISYCKNRRVSETASANYNNIIISPEDFQDLLLDKIGFRRVENFTFSSSDTNDGFERPLLVFWK